METNGLFLQTTRTRAPHPLEMFVRLEGPQEFHFYAQGLTFADFAALFEKEIRPLAVLIYRMPPDLLNPNYWEPLTKENEDAVREKMLGIVTKTEGERTLLWRSDHVAKTRLLGDGLDVPVEMLSGYIFRTTGEGLLKLGRAWSGRDRFEWVGLTSLPKGDLPNEILTFLHNDLAQMRPSVDDEVFLFSTQDDDAARVVFFRDEHLHRAVEALVRGFVRNLTGGHLGHINRRVCGQLARLADGTGLSTEPEVDVLDKGRTVEVTARLGRTPWGLSRRRGVEPPADDARILVYYDRISGIWAISS